MRNNKAVEADLTGKAALLWLMLRRGDPCTVEELHAHICAPAPHLTRRGKQMAVGRVIAVINSRIKQEGFRVSPGTPRGTYVLTRQ